MYRPRRRGRAIFYLLVFLFALALGLFLIERSLRPAFEVMATQLVKIRAGDAVHRAVLKVLGKGVTYSDLYLIQRNPEGMVTFLQPNTAAISRVAAEVALVVQDELKRLEDQRFGIPLSQALGMRLLAGLGPEIGVGVQSLGNVKVTLDSRFEQAGMNQTRHIVYLVIKADMQIATPASVTVFPLEERVPVAEGIIVGPVPQGGVLFKAN